MKRFVPSWEVALLMRAISEKLRAYGRAESVVSGLGILFLGCCFVLWNLEIELSFWGRCSALLSLILFIWVCLNFVPAWFRSWRERRLSTVRVDAQADASAAIFFSLLAFCLGMTLLVWLIRLAQGHAESYFQSLEYWTYTDSHHYLDIARDWYLSEGEWDRLVQLVFLPGYPVVIRLVRVIVRDYLAAAFLISAFSFAGAGALLYKLFRLDYGHASALRSVKFLCLLPGSFFFASPMSESLFLLCCAGCLYLVRRGKLGLGCLVGGYAAFTRSLGLMLFAPVFFELVQSKRGWKHFLWLLLIPAGFGVYCYINYLVAGDPFKYMEYQSVHWSQNLGFFFNTAGYQLDNVISYIKSGSNSVLGLWIPNLIWSFFALIVMIPAAKRLRPSYTVWFICYYAVAIGATWLLSAPRYLVAMPVISLALALDTGKHETAATLALLPFSFLYLLAFTMSLQVW